MQTGTTVSQARKGRIRLWWEEQFGAGDGELHQKAAKVPVLSYIIGFAAAIYLIEFVAHQDIIIIFGSGVGPKVQATLNIAVFLIQTFAGVVVSMKSLARIGPNFRRGDWVGVLSSVDMILYVLAIGALDTISVAGVLDRKSVV